MKLFVSGKSMEISEAVKAQVEKKLAKLDKMFKHETEAHVNFSKHKNIYNVEITIPLKNSAILRAVGKEDDMYKAIDDASDKIIRQMRKHRTKLEKKFQSNDSIRFDQIPESEGGHDEPADQKIVRTKRFIVKPMSAEEAVLQMDLIGHDFYVFLNSETGEVNVVYKRGDGDYGQIEPELE